VCEVSGVKAGVAGDKSKHDGEGGLFNVGGRGGFSENIGMVGDEFDVRGVCRFQEVAPAFESGACFDFGRIACVQRVFD